MRILHYVKEAFDASMPQFIRDWMLQYGDKYYSSSNRAEYVGAFDPSTAKFKDVSDMSTNELRNWIKSGEYMLFAKLKPPYGYGKPVTVAISSDPTNSVNRLKLVGMGASDFKEKSFKWICEHAISLYAVKTSSDRKDKQIQRRNARKGLISRDGQPQDHNRPFTFNGADWKQDASGYWYDANRLVKKLAALHENDSTYYINKGAEIFKNMVDVFADTIKSKAANFDKDSFPDFWNDKSFSRFIYEGQRILEDAGRAVSAINEEGSMIAESLESINAKRAENGAEPLDQKTYEDGIEYAKSEVRRHFANLKSYQRKLNELLSR